jgi:hypothetical protein
LAGAFLDGVEEELEIKCAAIAAFECGYCDEEVRYIFWNEVAPAVAFNIFDTAPMWGVWDPAWLEKQILNKWRILYWFDRLVLVPIAWSVGIGGWLKKVLDQVHSQRNSSGK